MSLSDSVFIFCLLPLILGLYYISKDEFKEYILLVASILFYAFGSPEFTIIMLAYTVLNVLFSRLIYQSRKEAVKKTLLILGIVADISILVFYKYKDALNFGFEKLTGHVLIGGNILLPLGISFFTFKAISYLADSYTGKIKLTRNPVHDALYLTFFAQIVSGPLSRYNDLENKMAVLADKKAKFDLFSEGVLRFMLGFIKKMIVADNLGRIANEVFACDLNFASAGYLWLGSICFSLQLYYDFSGYSDMAIGITKMLGYDCPENFNYPYTTASVSEFWRRWHMSLSFWFRDYVYIPLGGSKNKSRVRTYFNLFAVWILTGIWHGAGLHFVVWGLGYFVLISLERLTGLPKKLKNGVTKALYRVFSLCCINLLWVMFNASGLKVGLSYIKGMFFGAKVTMTSIRTGVLIKEYLWVIVIAIVFCMPVVPKIKEYVKGKKKQELTFNVLATVIVVGLFALGVAFAVSGQNNPFMYANF